MAGDSQLIFPALVATCMSSLRHHLFTSCATLIALFIFLSLGCENSLYIRRVLFVRYEICRPRLRVSSRFLTVFLTAQSLFYFIF